ncbi:MAG: secretion system protein F [Gammaproteobacteria bacterium RIFCSPLOWO2_02_FULL_47_50]|nr:MAG: secretion system protein F [Gammaproteobacteria bacterium RIFCSPLOWO2_01_FULL_47_190]OGT72197.1 MAG: secretion system protein F [Gammaproteobacteria bacterium RIFCSPLOWO2_12_47_11]OGT78484.1 MAG: secretion system protein F [Gammaproteobacteria bacterium RIFCSPLOWO2_02_FULL_47_50]OGT84728.1 MAG: secretion system protein F [Gammaproteobacteria bacterium RIFCSPLOWO2_12_FULL_47_76]
MLNFAGDALFFISIVGVFLSASCLAYAVFIIGNNVMSGYKETFTESASANMADMFMFIDATRLFYINLLAIVVVPVLVWLIIRDLPTAIGVFALIAIMPGFMYRSMRKKRFKRFEEQLPDGLLMLTGAMRSGASLNIALEGLVKEQPAPLSQEFELFMREQRIGTDFDKSLTNMEKRVPIQDFAMVTSALRINREIGGNLAEILESLAETLRRKQQMEGKIESLTAQGKLQGIVMTGLPVLLGVLLYFMEPENMEKLWTTTVGYIVLGIIIIMEFMGYVMIRKITSIDV